MLEAWLHLPHVRRWWGDPEAALAEVCHRAPGSGYAMINADGLPVGYLCWQPYAQQDRDAIGWAALPNGALDMDIMIGELSHLGRGVGPQAIRLLFQRLAENPSVELVGLATSVENSSAIRAYEKVGFSAVREFDDPGFGRCQFMVADPREVGRPTTR
jgi:aminoglycoside 6'-N-acetyltransferase